MFGSLTPETRDPRDPSFWETDVGLIGATPALTEDAVVDVAIVGAGITGLSAACTLKRLAPELRVCVLDSHRPCSGASTRSSGHMRSEYNSWKKILEGKGVEAARSWNGFGRRGFDAVMGFLDDNDIDCELRRDPLLWVATPDRLTELSDRAAKMDAVGMPARLVQGGDFQDRLGSDYYAGGLEVDTNFNIHPGKMMQGYLRTALALGVTVYSESPVVRVSHCDSDGETNLLTTPEGTVTAPKVLFATNAYTPRIGGLLSSRLVPVVLCTVVTEPMPAQQKSQASHWDSMVETDTLCRSMGHTSDDRVFFRSIVGYAAFNSATWSEPSHAFARAEREMHMRMPWSRELKVTHRWLGSIAMSGGLGPIAGALPDKGQYVSAGYGGSGNVHAFYHGQIVAHQMLGEPHADEEFLRTRASWIPPEPLRTTGAKTYFFFAL